MKKGYKISILVSVTISVIILALFYNSSSQSLFPFQNADDVFLGIYHEPLESNFSEGEFEIEDNKLAIQYKLGSGSMDPFIGFFIHKQHTIDSFFDFENFNEIRLHISATKATRIPITYTVNYKGFTNADEELTNIPFTTLIDYTDPGWYSIKMADFEKQSWWFREQHKKEDDFPNISLKRVNYFVVGSCQILGHGGEDRIEISAIELGNNNSTMLVFWMAISGLVILITVLLGLRKKEKVLVPVVGQEVVIPSNTNLEKITNYIAQHYNNSELTKDDLQKELALSSRQIGTELKEGLNASFKNYLNQIRLAEVKRLLIESELPISDIAYKCGYNNISHFNRVFKTQTGKSPKQFREE